MARKFVIVGVLYLASVVVAGVLDIRNDESKDTGKGKEPEKNPHIVRDYVCLRDGELCHPEFGRNRGLYVSCSNGVAWEQQCPPCSYHPYNCPTRTLWFDGKTCDWASVKLASQPCIDHFPEIETETNYDNSEKEGAGNGLSGQESYMQSFQVPQMSAVQVGNVKEPVEKNKWQMMNSMSVPVPMYYKSPKSEEPASESAESAADNISVQKDVKVAPESELATNDVDASSDEKSSNNVVESRKSSGDSESEFPSYLNADDGVVGAKIVRLNDPVYTLVNSPDGSGKQVLMRISQPFVLEDSARSAFEALI